MTIEVAIVLGVILTILKIVQILLELIKKH